MTTLRFGATEMVGYRVPRERRPVAAVHEVVTVGRSPLNRPINALAHT